MANAIYHQRPLFSEDHPVSQPAYQETEEDQKTSDGYGEKHSESLKKSILKQSYLRTYPVYGLSMRGVSFEKSSGVLPEQGIVSNGELYQLPTWELPIRENGYGLWPTPVASDLMERLPSPTPHLTQSGTWRHIAKNGDQSCMRLSQVVKLWATLTASSWRSTGQLDSKSYFRGLAKAHFQEQVIAAERQVAPLNPLWCEMLMGLPPNFSAIDGPQDKGSISTTTNHLD